MDEYEMKTQNSEPSILFSCTYEELSLIMKWQLAQAKAWEAANEVSRLGQLAEPEERFEPYTSQPTEDIRVGDVVFDQHITWHAVQTPTGLRLYSNVVGHFDIDRLSDEAVWLVRGGKVVKQERPKEEDAAYWRDRWETQLAHNNRIQEANKNRRLRMKALEKEAKDLRYQIQEWESKYANLAAKVLEES